MLSTKQARLRSNGERELFKKGTVESYLIKACNRWVNKESHYSLFLIPYLRQGFGRQTHSLFTLFLTSLLAISSNPLRSQNLDSLYSTWQDQTQTDSTRAYAFNDYIFYGFLYSNPDSAFKLADELVQFGHTVSSPTDTLTLRPLIINEEVLTQIELPKATAMGFNIQGLALNLQGDYDRAILYFEAAYRINESRDDPRWMAGNLSNLGWVLHNRGEYIKALDAYEQAIELYQSIEAKRFIARAYGNMGITYADLGQKKQALNYYNKAVTLIEEFGEDPGYYLHAIGLIYAGQEKYDQARELYERALVTAEERNDQRAKASILNNFGTSYQAQKNYTTALDYHRRALKIRKELGLSSDIATSLFNIASINNLLEDFEQSLSLYEKALAIHQENNSLSGIAKVKIDMGSVHANMKNYGKSVQLCKEGLKLAQEMEYLEIQKNACTCLYETYKETGNRSEALGYLEKIQVLDDSLHASDIDQQLQQMEYAKSIYQDSVETFEKERQVELAHQEEMRQEEQQRNMAYVGGLIALLLAGGFYSRWRYVRKSKAIIEKEKDRSENLLLNILPAEIAQELKETGKASARDFDQVSILFTDFADFTETAEKLSASELVEEINHCFEAFDHILEKYKIEKIKTIGDAYMAAGGLPVPGEDSVKNTVLAALEMQDFIKARSQQLMANSQPHFQMRVGIHTGPVVAGIVGVKKFQYDVWGDTVNTASRIENAGEVGKVNISQATYELLRDPEPVEGSDEGSESRALREVEGQLVMTSPFEFESRGKIEVKGKGYLQMWYVKTSRS